MSWAPSRPPMAHHTSSSSEVRARVGTPRAALLPLLAEVEVFLIPAKLDLGVVIGQIEAMGGTLVSEPSEARIVVTALKGRPRIARVLGDNIDEQRILDVRFVEEAYRRCLEGRMDLPPWGEYRVFTKRRESRSPRKRKRDEGGVIDFTVESSEEPEEEPPRSLEAMEAACVGERSDTAPPDVKPYPEDIDFRTIPRLACERPSPLTCPNQDIIDAIKPIFLEREFDHLSQLNTNVLSYRRSMAILKSVPRRVTSGADALKLVDVGDKVANRIDEYLETGRIEEAELIKLSPRFIALQSFSSVYSIGHATASQLWHDGCRNLEDVKRYFSKEEPESRREERKAEKRKFGGGMNRAEIVDAWIKLKDELDKPIPRDETVEIANCVGESLDALCPGCEWVITGGYRRGKPATGDVDIVFKPPEQGMDIGLLGSLYRRLVRLGVITHVLHVTARDVNQPLHSSGANFDNLDKVYCILKLPGDRLHRRVDLICAPVERYAAAVLSWSGSMMFERDARRYIEDRGLKFRAGLIDPNTLRELNYPTEREIFQAIQLPYVPCTLRNCDG